MIGYAMLGTNNQARSSAFYDTALQSVGVGRLMEFPTGAIVWGVSLGLPMIAVGLPHDGAPATAGNGAMIALTLDSRAKVETLHAAALAAGAADEGAPGVRGEEGPQAFYGAYFRDLDGNKLCAFCVGPAT